MPEVTADNQTQQVAPEAAQQGISAADLEKATNEMYGQDFVPQSQPSPSEAQSPDAVETEPAPELETAAPEAKGGQADLTDEEKGLLNELRAMKEITGTPFKTLSDLVKAYKELQSTYTKEHEFVTKAKPVEQLVSSAIADPNLAQYLAQAKMLYDNPQLASAYVGQGGRVDTPPDPRSYNMFDEADLGRYQKDLSDYNARAVDARINARLAGIESQTRLEKMKSELKQVYGEANPDEVLSWIQSKGNNWNLVDAYKVKEFDNIETRAMEKARKELTTKLEQANRGTQPQATTSGAKQTVKIDDILTYISKYGGEAAKKKYGPQNFEKAMRESVNF